MLNQWRSRDFYKVGVLTPSGIPLTFFNPLLFCIFVTDRYGMTRNQNLQRIHSFSEMRQGGAVITNTLTLSPKKIISFAIRGVGVTSYPPLPSPLCSTDDYLIVRIVIKVTH